MDILNCMGLGDGRAGRLRRVPRGGRASAWRWRPAWPSPPRAPIVANLDWNGVPQIIHEYLAPGAGRGRFPFFPCASYIGLGIGVGTIVKRLAAERMERLMQWSVLAGFALVFGAQYFSNLPYSLYAKSSFWTDSPALVLIRTGICLLFMAGAYIWTEHGAGARWSWMQAMGKTSLMVYWVHVMLVYGDVSQAWRRALSIPQAAAATVALTAAMVGLSAAKLRWTERRKAARPAVIAA